MERALLVTVDLGKDKNWTALERSAELGELAYSSGATVIREEVVRRRELTPNYFLGKGKAEEIRGICLDEDIGVVIFNNDLRGTQQKNLEEVILVKTIDRTQLILDIFARRARSNEGKVQVELAQLLYLLPRLTGKGVMLSRLGGGIGTRGPGEQKLEVDRRRIRARIAKLRKELDDLSSRRAIMRKHRSRFASLAIAIVGYTNVGKSTLLNALTRSAVVTEDKLFSTLDPTVRKFILPDHQKVLFIDTVGFLQDLPHHLIEAFKATLEEVVEADLILHLIDSSHQKAKEQAQVVYRTLEELGVRDKPIIPVLNKIDRVGNWIAVERAKGEFYDALAVSALSHEGFPDLIGRIQLYVEKFLVDVKLEIPVSDMKLVNLIYENGNVQKKEYRDDKVYIEARVPLRIKEMIERRETGTG
jgi:GTP-binding protein HflX